MYSDYSDKREGENEGKGSVGVKTLVDTKPHLAAEDTMFFGLDRMHLTQFTGILAPPSHPDQIHRCRLRKESDERIFYGMIRSPPPWIDLSPISSDLGLADELR